MLLDGLVKTDDDARNTRTDSNEFRVSSVRPLESCPGNDERIKRVLRMFLVICETWELASANDKPW